LQISDFRFQIEIPRIPESEICILNSEISFALFMRRVLPAEPAEFAHLEPLGRLLLVLRRAVVPPLTFQAGQRDDVSHSSFLGFGNRVMGNLAIRLPDYPLSQFPIR
jgi:hypothetical protein